MRLAEPLFSPWKAALALGFQHRNGRTVLAEKRFDGPLVVQKPLYPEGDAVCHAILVHPPAGIVGGDQISLRVTAAAETSVLLTAPGAGKWYRSAGAWATQSLRFDIDGSLEWLPPETIIFDGALAQLQSDIHLGPQATYIGWEILCLGRSAVGQPYSRGRIGLRNRIYRAGKPVWLESGTIDPAGELMRSPAGLDGKSICATLIACAPQIESSVLVACRRVEDVAITLVPGLLIARHLGESSELARQRFTELWHILRPALLGRAAHLPRIWST